MSSWTSYPFTNPRHPQKALVPHTSIMFVSEVSKDTVATYGLKKRIEAVKNCRKAAKDPRTRDVKDDRILGKSDMKCNSTKPKMRVDPETYVSNTTNPFFLLRYLH
jgi:urease alpha subunit